MLLIRCYYENGDKITTAINLSFEEAKDYFEGKVFNLGMLGRYEDDKMQRCVRIEEIKSYKKDKI